LDVQVISPVPVTLCHDAPPAGAATLARAQNDFLAGFVAAAPERFVAFGAVPLQAPALAVAELARCVGELGFAGVEIGTVAGDVELSDVRMGDFWAAADELGATVFVHPANLPCGARLGPLDLAFGVGMPCETATAAAGLLVAGILRDHPDLQILLAHGGGALPWLLPRLDKGWEILPRQRELIPEPPSHYARRFLVDSLTYDAAALWLAVERFGPGRVFLGTDAPFAAAEEPPGAVLTEALGKELLDQDEAEMIAGGNAARLLKLPVLKGGV
jgi:aminocarboxymuconate-semialdehyde decarboxylase